MKVACIFACVFFLSTAVYAQNNKNCEAAVDAAASMNMNQTECDYSDKGLNGFLQKAFKRGEEGATLKTGDSKETTSNNNVPEIERNANKNKPEKINTKSFLLNAEANQWADITAERTLLLAKAMEKCRPGFTIARETYRSLAGNRIKLEMGFECID